MTDRPTFTELLPEDVHAVVSRLPKDLRTIAEKRGSSIFIGGGFVRAVIAGETPSDIDIFGPSEEVMEETARDLKVARVEANERAEIGKTRNALTVMCPPRLPVQFIKRWLYDKPEDLLPQFDFTVAMAAVWYDKDIKEWKSLAHPRFYPDLANHRLTYSIPVRHEDAGGSLLRVLKFLGRGYRISPESFGKVIARLCMGVKWGHKNIIGANNELNHHVLARVLTALMRQVDPLNAVDGVEVVEDDDATPDDIKDMILDITPERVTKAQDDPPDDFTF